MTAAVDTITAAAVIREVMERYGDEWDAQNVADTYESMQAMAARRKAGVWYTPQPVVDFMTRFAFDIGMRRIGPRPVDIFALVAIDPCCGTGPYLIQAARFLATQYAGRLVGGSPSGDLVYAVMPTVVLNCVFGVDIDPVAAELARICLAREMGDVLTPDQLARHVAQGDTLQDQMPPALVDRLALSGGAAPTGGAAG